MHDPCAVAAVLDPSLITTQRLYVDVETRGELTTGQTVVDYRGGTGRPANVDVGLDIDRERFVKMLFDAIRRYD